MTDHGPGTDVATPGPDTATAPATSPYRPLTSFDETDAAVFAGRTDLRRRLHLRVTTGEGPVVLLGPAGSGKTSLLRAGLIPEVRATGLRTRDGRVDASTVVLHPGSDAVGALAEALGVGRTDLDDVGATPDVIAASPTVSVGTDARHRGCLVVVDGLEEVFRWCGHADRSHFLQVLDTLGGDDRFAVVLGLSAEWSAEAFAEPVLVTALDTRSVVVAPMSTAEVIEAVELPARVAGARTQPGLGEAIAADLATAGAGTPPLIALGVMLDHLWHTRIVDAPEPLTLEAYRASDPIGEITAVAADRAWSQLTPTDRDTARVVLLAAADGSPTARDTTVLLRRLARPRLERVIARLGEAHLIRVVDGRVELTHRSLTTAWPRLDAWLADRAVAAPIRDRTATDATRWAQGHRPSDELYDDDRLRRAESALEPFDDLGPDSAPFLERSRERLRLRRSRRRILLTAAALVAIGALVSSVVLGVGLSRSDAARDDARLDAAVARAAATAQSDPTTSALTARTAYASHPDDTRAESAVLATQTSALGRPLGIGATRAVATPASGTAAPSVVVGSDGSLGVVDPASPSAAAADADVAEGPQTVAVTGSTAVSIDTSGRVRLWRIASGVTPVAVGELGAERRAVAVVALPDQNRVAVADTGRLRIVAVDDPARPAVVATLALPATPTALAATGPTILVGDVDGDVTVVDARGGRMVGALPRRDSAVTALAATTGSTAVADASGRVGVFRTGPDGLASGPATDLAGDRGRVDALSYSPGGGPGRPAAVLAVTAGGSTEIVDPGRPGATRPVTDPLRAPGGLAAARFTTDGSVVSAGSGDARWWSLPAGIIPATSGFAATPSCSAARAICAIPHTDGPVQVVDVRDPRAPVVAGVVDAPDHFDGAAVAPSGMWMMTVDAAHRAQLWDTRSFARPIAVGPPVSLGPGPVGTVSFSPTSSALAMTRDGGASLGVWSVTPGGLVDIADLDIGTPVTAAAWSGDGGQIAVGGRSGVLRWTVSSTVVGAISGRIASTTAVTSLAYGQAEGRGDPGSGDATSLRPVLLVGDGTGGVSRFDVDGGGALGPRIPVGSAAITSITSIGATSATGSADGTVHRIAGDGTAVRVADVYPDQGSGDVRVGALDDSVVAVGDEIAGRVIGLRTSTVAERICTRVGC